MNNAITLLKRALVALDTVNSVSIGKSLLREQIQDFLDADPEAEPVAWTNQDELNALLTDVTCYMYSEPMAGENNIPLYTISKPARKPMTEKKIVIEFTIAKNQWTSKSKAFEAGVRFAEKHHGIIPRCENF